MCDESGESSSECPAAKKRVYQQAFLNSWLQDSVYASWLEKVEDIFEARCKACNKTIRARKSSLNAHARSEKHKFNLQNFKEGTTGFINFETQVKMAEIRFTLDVVEHNLSFYSRGHFIAMNNIAVPNHPILQRCTLGRNKMAAIVTNVLSKYIHTQTLNIVRGKYFSILMDESTDICSIKNICILIRYIDGPEIKTQLLDFIRVNTTDAVGLFNSLMYCLEKNNLQISNLIGFCADKANVMMGENNSVASRLLEVNNEICIFPYIYHSFHLIAKHAFEALPEEIGDFLSDVYTYFARSDKRRQTLEDKQRAMKLKVLKILEPSLTRCLTMNECIVRIVSQWPALHEVFREATDRKATRLFKTFEDGYMKAYLEFLKLPLKLFSEFNILFQKKNVAVHIILPQSTRLLNHLSMFFIKRDCIQNMSLHGIDIDNEDNLIPLEQIFIGEEALITINGIRNTVHNNKIADFYTNVRNFYKITYKELISRLPFNEKFLMSLNFLNPEIALGERDNSSDQIIYNIIERFPSKFDKLQVAQEWRKLPDDFSEEEIQLLKVMNIEDFWHKVSSIKGPDDKYMFENIAKVAQLCLSLPHSNADVERLFSKVTNIKTYHRNKLRTETVAALTRIQLDLQNKKQDCRSYQIPSEMVKLHNSSMYKKEPIPAHLSGILLLDDDSASESEVEPITG